MRDDRICIQLYKGVKKSRPRRRVSTVPQNNQHRCNENRDFTDQRANSSRSPLSNPQIAARI